MSAYQGIESARQRRLATPMSLVDDASGAPAVEERTPFRPRVAWVDYAKGWCIVLVVAMHSALGVGLAVEQHSWLHAIAAFAKPFRMPDFFLVAGLFAAGAIHGPWRRFLDRKVVHFAYFYAVWLFIELAIKSHDLAIDTPSLFAHEYARHLAEPFGSMWFIQVLPLLYLVTRFARDLPFAVLLVLGVALHYLAASVPGGGAYAMESHLTASTTLNSLMLFWIYFLLGYRGRAAIFRVAAWLDANPMPAMSGFAAWAVLEAVVTSSGAAEWFGLDLPLGLLGAGAVIALSVMFSKTKRLAWLAGLGRQSLTIYLAFFLPMAATRLFLVWLAPEADVGILSLAVTIAAIVGPLVLRRLVTPTPLAFLFVRPAWTRIGGEAAPTG